MDSPDANAARLILTVLDDPAWRDDLQARFVVVVDTRQEHLAPFFGTAVGTLPLHLVVTRDGIVRYKKLGAIPTDVKAVVEGWLP